MRPLLPVLFALPLGLVFTQASPALAQRCEWLSPIGGDGVNPEVTKTIGPPKVSPIGLIAGKTNWNTDFIVSKPYRSYRFVFTAQSSAKATYPIEGYLKFSDGSALRVINETITPQVGGSRQWGPFPAVPGKAVSQLNLKIGSSRDPGSTGFTYRIGSQGCF
ncbi:MAG: hypothetical protein ACKOPN_01170 [Prochlorococcaceae cyanobacterium]|jgi:hypothetical protein